MKKPQKAKHILKEASLLQKNDDKLFGKKFRSLIEDNERVGNTTKQEAFLNALSIKSKQPVRWREILLRKKNRWSRQ